MKTRALRADEGMLIRRVRLRSLADAPHAFGAESFEAESALPDEYWHELAARVGGQDPQWRDRCVSFVVPDGDGDGADACGTATCYLCPHVTGHAYVTSAWIAPGHRRRGLGRSLVDAAGAWALERGASRLRLWVDDTNPAAADFYVALGFVETGESRPVSPGSSESQRLFERVLQPEPG